MFTPTIKQTFFFWCTKNLKSLPSSVSALTDEDEETKIIIEQKIKSLARTKVPVMKFIVSYDTTTFQSKIITHIKALLETSSEWVKSMNRSKENKYEIPVLDGKILDLETKKIQTTSPN